MRISREVFVENIPAMYQSEITIGWQGISTTEVSHIFPQKKIAE